MEYGKNEDKTTPSLKKKKKNHLYSLTQQSTSSHFTGFSNAANHWGGNVDVQLATGEVVEKEEWLCPLSEHVVHTHRNQVLTQTVMLAACLCDLKINPSWRIMEINTWNKMFMSMLKCTSNHPDCHKFSKNEKQNCSESRELRHIFKRTNQWTRQHSCIDRSYFRI